MTAMASTGKSPCAARVVGSQRIPRSHFASARRAVRVHDRHSVDVAQPLVRSPAFEIASRALPLARPISAAAVEESPAAPAKSGWWTRESAENMVEITSLPQLVEELGKAQDKLVIVDFYAQWCNACRALYPKLCKLCRENPDIVLLKVDWKANKAMCKILNIKVLPYFHFYRGAEGRVEAFSASITKFSRLRDAIALHGPSRCSLGPALNIRELVYDSTPAVDPSSKADGKKDSKENAAGLLTSAAKF
ncbi:hypothetical protein BSKO_10052 [Bryopsis sp. KO-2023]|nr:hypothetical protein BSKO_10052 [Bryopsis sp. KO-2023]